MSLINCPECNYKVSDKAECCPKCAFPIKDKNKKSGLTVKDGVKTGFGIFIVLPFFIILGIIVLLFIFGIIGSSKSDLNNYIKVSTELTEKRTIIGSVSANGKIQFAGASQFSGGTEIMRIANLQEMEVNVEVNENDIDRVAFGDTSIIEVDAYLNKKFKGIVTEIATSANTLSVSVDQVTNFDVKIRILKESYKDLIPEDNPRFSPLRPGMSATVDIQTETAHNVLTVPIQAVTTNYVFLYVDGIAKMQEVKTGIQNNTFIEITEGLEDGQEVIVAPYRAVSKKLKNGDEVKKVPKKDLFASED